MSLVTELEWFTLNKIAKAYGIEMQERSLPTPSDVEAVVADRVTVLLEAKLRDRDALKGERSQRFVALARQLAENEDESALIAMLLDDYYQQSLHAPLQQPADVPPASAAPRKKLGTRPRRARRSVGRPSRR